MKCLHHIATTLMRMASSADNSHGLIVAPLRQNLSPHMWVGGCQPPYFRSCMQFRSAIVTSVIGVAASSISSAAAYRARCCYHLVLQLCRNADKEDAH
mmetsp:Transcript_11859/g.32637  ORF Transcript_11859/g.32637 Transcript_11859/m.32637 type:complete len:98 (+) Transcript_11859:157-450(+)